MPSFNLQMENQKMINSLLKIILNENEAMEYENHRKMIKTNFSIENSSVQININV